MKFFRSRRRLFVSLYLFSQSMFCFRYFQTTFLVPETNCRLQLDTTSGRRSRSTDCHHHGLDPAFLSIKIVLKLFPNKTLTQYLQQRHLVRVCERERKKKNIVPLIKVKHLLKCPTRVSSLSPICPALC